MRDCPPATATPCRTAQSRALAKNLPFPLRKAGSLGCHGLRHGPLRPNLSGPASLPLPRCMSCPSYRLIRFHRTARRGAHNPPRTGWHAAPTAVGRTLLGVGRQETRLAQLPALINACTGPRVVLGGNVIVMRVRQRGERELKLARPSSEGPFSGFRRDKKERALPSPLRTVPTRRGRDPA